MVEKGQENPQAVTSAVAHIRAGRGPLLGAQQMDGVGGCQSGWRPAADR